MLRVVEIIDKSRARVQNVIEKYIKKNGNQLRFDRKMSAQSV